MEGKHSAEKKLDTVKMPDGDEMFRRLQSVDKWPTLMNNCYPVMLQAAGQSLNSHGVVLMLLSGISELDGKVDKRVSAPLYNMIPQFIDVLVDDDNIREEAKQYWDSLLDQYRDKETTE